MRSQLREVEARQSRLSRWSICRHLGACFLCEAKDGAFWRMQTASLRNSWPKPRWECRKWLSRGRNQRLSPGASSESVVLSRGRSGGRLAISVSCPGLSEVEISGHVRPEVVCFLTELALASEDVQMGGRLTNAARMPCRLGVPGRHHEKWPLLSEDHSAHLQRDLRGVVGLF